MSSENNKKRVTQLGDFKLKKKLGKGGMGEVYLATQVSLDRLVAIKTLSKELAKNETFVKRFQREMKSMAKLDHTNIVKVYAVDSIKNLHFAAIEYVDGKSVQDWLDALQKLSIGDAVHITIACAEALRHAHETGTIHRDIKPDNVLVTKKGIVKVADFGLAKAMDNEDVSMTQSGSGLGTPLYMAPEQARDAKHVDQRADIYALGATLYHLISGALPFSGDSALQLILAKEKGKFVPIRQLVSGCPEKLSLIIDRMMAKEPSHRYSNCDDVINDLESLGIASPALTFLDGAVPVMSRRAVSPAAVTSNQQSRTSTGVDGNVDSRKDAKRAEAKERARKDRMWYIRHKNAKKKLVVSRMTTRQAVQAIKTEILDPTSEAKVTAEDSFRLMAEMPEFAAAMEKRMVRVKAKVKANDMKSLYTQIDKAEKRRHSKRFFRNLMEGTLGYFGLLIWLVVLCAVIYGGYLAVQFLPNFFAEKLGVG